jgi:signal transduction histidine kinase
VKEPIEWIGAARGGRAGIVDSRAGDLRLAASRVTGLWSEHDAARLLLPGMVRAELDAVVADILASLAGIEALGTRPGGDPILRRRLIELLRCELIEMWREGPGTPDAADMLAVLSACETLRRTVASDWDDGAVAMLSSPDGLSLVSEVAHDLRSPLTAVLFLADNLRRGNSGPLNDVQARQIGIIYGAALGLTEVASDLIDLGRKDRRNTFGEPSPFSLYETLTAVQGTIQPIAEEKQLEVRLSVDEPDRRLGHAVPLQRALLNLATNALKFTDVGYVEISARCADHATVCFAVEDSGRGIPPQAQERLFQPFRGGPDRGYAFSGTGLGLMIVRRLVNALGGELAFETEPGRGTRFHFTLHLPTSSRY